jgi:hypothetical protein
MIRLFTKKTEKEIKEILIQGFSTQPMRDYFLESRMDEKKLKIIREDNLKHIDEITKEIMKVIKPAS